MRLSTKEQVYFRIFSDDEIDTFLAKYQIGVLDKGTLCSKISERVADYIEEREKNG